ncbi:unnamed protein product [Rhizophagus irregularis]|nr:unnamed protein product [Rhizophagus irregularis]
MIREIAPRFRKLTPKMLVNIKKYVIQGQIYSSSIYPLLKHNYSDQPIYKKDLYNAVYQFCQKNNPGDMDASQLFELLMKWKDAEPLWIVKLRLDSVSRKLNSLLWMFPIQRELYSKYNDVTIIDTTYNTNRFQMMLYIISLKGKLGNKFEEFHHKFYTCRNSLCEDLFELRWNQLINQYPASAKFTTGVQSTQSIELINKHIHDKVDRATSLCDLLHNIKDHVKNEEYLENFKLERNAIPTIGMPMLNTRFFGPIDNIIKVFLTPIMLGKQRSQMNQSYLDQSNDLSQYSPIPVCDIQIDNRIEMEKSITFQHFFSFRVDSHGSHLAINSIKAIYAKLFGLSKNATDCAIKSNMQHELVNLLKAFNYDMHNKNVQETQETQETKTFTDINNPTITKHKGRPPKRLKSSVETSEKHVLKDSTNVNITENETRG